MRLLRRLRSNEVANRPLTALLKLVFSKSKSEVPDAVVKHLPRVGPVRVSTPDGASVILRSRGDEGKPTQIYWRGLAYAEPDAILFYHLARSSRITIDVGAHIGLYSLLAAHANPRGRVFAMEPLPRAYGRLVSNVNANSQNNIVCLPWAAGDIDRREDFYFVPVESIPSSSGLKRDFFCGDENTEEIKSLPVQVVPLDSLLSSEDAHNIDLVKIDTESTEPAVLKGMRNILKHSRPNVLCEVLASTGTATEIEDALDGLGYRFYHLTPEDAVQRERIVGHDQWRNYFFTADDLHRTRSYIDQAFINRHESPHTRPA